MGNSLACFSPSPTTSSKSKASSPKELLPPWLSPSASHRKSRKLQSSASSEVVFDDSYIKQQAQIASMLYQQHLQNNINGGGDLLLHLDRSVSTRNPPSSSKKSKNLSMRSRSVSCSTAPLSSLQLPNQDVARSDDGQENKHFVLVHGGGFGAWCWYKIIALLKESKCEVDAIDLTGSGANFCDINSIKTLAQYANPLTQFLANLADNKKVILVGHDLGGACISYAMEMYPHKVSKAIFVAATMLTDGQRALDVFSQKDIALASVSMRGVPFAPVTEKISLSEANYGSISRFYIKTDDNFAIPQPLQEAMIQSNPPTQVFDLKNSDHSPFFSRPQALHRLLTEISNLA
ncbi:hypothetical protein DH2020_012039 [Rehmannia glutinosa]|uniref:AB hydrolase-1 domain-containing protein n=1 Tax=Rehmannia glutinosa TaxID=99300 RepID=A0ABR0XF73_REHGL